VGGRAPKRKQGRLERGPLTGIEEPVYEPGEWHGHRLTDVVRTARYGRGASRRAAVVLCVLMALPVVVIVVASAISAIT
jgi:hypothetical protein